MIPFQIHRFIYFPGRRLYGFIARGRSRPGILAEIGGLFASRGLDITYTICTPALSCMEGWMLLVVDFTDSGVEPGEMAEALRSLEYVDEVEVVEPSAEGLLIDYVTFPLMLGRGRCLLLDEGMMRGLFIDFRERLGSGGEAMLYHLGLEAGRSRGRHSLEMAERLGIGELGEGLRIVEKGMKALGYGVIRFLEVEEEPPYMRVRVERSIECEIGRGYGKPFSQFIRGLLTGIASECFQREMTAREVKCIAMGDPYCEFELKPQM